MNWLKAIVWPGIKAGLSNWLTSRALVIPAAKVAGISQQAADAINKRLGITGVTPEMVSPYIQQADQEAITQAVSLLDQFKP